MVAKMVELRKGKMTEEQCRAAMGKGNYFGTMLVKMGKADCLLGGATYSNGGHGPPGAAADQVQARRQIGQLLLHSGPRRGKTGDGRLRHQH